MFRTRLEGLERAWAEMFQPDRTVGVEAQRQDRAWNVEDQPRGQRGVRGQNDRARRLWYVGFGFYSKYSKFSVAVLLPQWAALHPQSIPAWRKLLFLP